MAQLMASGPAARHAMPCSLNMALQHVLHHTLLIWASHLVSAWTSMLSRVRFWPLPGISRRKPAWLTGVTPSLPAAGDGAVICDVHAFAFPFPLSPFAAFASTCFSHAPAVIILLGAIQECSALKRRSMHPREVFCTPVRLLSLHQESARRHCDLLEVTEMPEQETLPAQVLGCPACMKLRPLGLSWG